MRKIILVDDKKVFRKSLTETLKIAGEVKIIGEASNGKEFLKLLNFKQPDIVFMDIEMPVMNGIEATKIALKKFPNLTIIGLSMYDNRKYIEHLMKVGARGYLLKESDNHQLFKTILNYPNADIFYSEDITYKPNISRNKIKNILLVDDFKTNVIAMKPVLEMAGFNVDTYFDPIVALENIQELKHQYDLLVIDFKMPNMNGDELTAEIRKIKEYNETPILILSNVIDNESRLKAKEAGATGWLKKPLQLDKFLMIIENSL